MLSSELRCKHFQYHVFHTWVHLVSLSFFLILKQLRDKKRWKKSLLSMMQENMRFAQAFVIQVIKKLIRLRNTFFFLIISAAYDFC